LADNKNKQAINLRPGGGPGRGPGAMGMPKEKPKNVKASLKRIISYAKERPGRMFQFLKYCPYLDLSKSEMQKYFGDAMEVHGVTYDKIKKP